MLTGFFKKKNFKDHSIYYCHTPIMDAESIKVSIRRGTYRKDVTTALAIITEQINDFAAIDLYKEIDALVQLEAYIRAAGDETVYIKEIIASLVDLSALLTNRLIQDFGLYLANKCGFSELFKLLTKIYLNDDTRRRLARIALANEANGIDCMELLLEYYMLPADMLTDSEHKNFKKINTTAYPSLITKQESRYSQTSLF
jgi:hypothetical protein